MVTGGYDDSSRKLILEASLCMTSESHYVKHISTTQ